MSDKKSSDSGSSLKSIEDIIGNVRDRIVPSKNSIRKLPYFFKEPIEFNEFIEKGPFIIPRDKEGNIKKFEQPDPKPFIIPRDKEGNRIPFDPKEGIELLSSKERYMINGMPTTKEGFEMFTNKFMRLNDQGKMMYEMLIEKNPDAGAEIILDLIMKRPEFLSGEETVGDMLEERTQSKANGGIVQLFGNM
tara:strand:+ start:45 stop:617 length:573 start_codon:yes stop_codon:yes gene_type:complete